MRLFFLMFLSAISRQGTAQDVSTYCGSGTILDVTTNQCVSSTQQGCPSNGEPSRDPNKIFLAGIFDLDSYDWGDEIFEYTISQINERNWSIFNMGRWDILQPNQHLEYSLRNARCDEATAVRGYWDLRTQNGNMPMDGIIGARCSGASISLARISGLEKVPMISPASNSAKLTDDPSENPYFSRMVAPNNEHGEVGAMIAMLRAFDWERVIVLGTDTQFAKDFITEFRKGWVGSNQDVSGDWVGSVSYSDTIRLTPTNEVDQDSIAQALSDIPADDTRVILLVAHAEHAFDIIEATEHHFQPDTIWVGPSTWANRSPPNKFPPQSGSIPGYFGVAPYRNRNVHYSNFMRGFQDWLQANRPQMSFMSELPTFAAEFVDSIVAMTMAISSTTNGTSIVRTLRQLDFEGVSGRVQFTYEGDRAYPKYSIVNAQSIASDGSILWQDVGITGSSIGTTTFKSDDTHPGLCFAKVGCTLSEKWPGDTYPELRVRLPVWIILLVVAFGLLFIVVSFRNWHSRRKIKRIRAELDAFRDSIVGMRAAAHHCIPKVPRDKEVGDIEQALSGMLPVAPVECMQWCWKETNHCMDVHDSNDIYGDPADCWIKYSAECNRKLEEAYAKGKPKCSPLSGYTVNFGEMKQTKVATGFERDVQRVLMKTDAKADVTKEIDLKRVHLRDELPAEIRAEPQMVLVEGDIVQISTQRQDGWAFGTKLHNADEAIARQLVEFTLSFSCGDGGSDDPADQADVLADTGWFQLDSTRMPTAEELNDCMRNVGDAGALDPPSNWDRIVDPTVAQRHELQEGDAERDAVVNAFMSSLKKRVKVIKVERVQNLAMWQSYVVKRQTICYRETGHVATSGGGDSNDDDIQRKALERFERRWLWHGSNIEVMDKILQQGLNRSFCGKNATAYGKGVYFARDTEYSSDSTYAIPDRNGLQYIMACRVVVGEYCRGTHNALTPDVRHHASQSLYDTTVGLLSGDTMTNPSIYVTYHDAQAYPEYLISFKAI